MTSASRTSRRRLTSSIGTALLTSAVSVAWGVLPAGAARNHPEAQMQVATEGMTIQEQLRVHRVISAHIDLAVEPGQATDGRIGDAGCRRREMQRGKRTARLPEAICSIAERTHLDALDLSPRIVVVRRGRRCRLGPAEGPQVVEQLVAGTSSPQQDEERILVKRLREQVVDGRDVLAR